MSGYVHRAEAMTKPFLCEWEKVKLTDETERLRVELCLSWRAAALIDGLHVGTMIRASEIAGGIPDSGSLGRYREALATYLAELEAEAADNRTTKRHP